MWRAATEAVSDLDRLTQLLTDDERRRADRFRFPRDRERFMAARGRLRLILSRYAQRDPKDFRFTVGQYGKPDLVDGGDLRFNVSHSHQLALYAFTRQREVGVDIEFIRPDFGTLDIAENYFSPIELAALRALPTDMHTDAFFTCWTRKEAYIKARGEGLSMPLSQFDVTLIPGEPARLLDNRRDAGEVERWSMTELMPGAGYKAALVVEGQDYTLACWQFGE